MIPETNFKSQVFYKDEEYYYLSAGKMRKNRFSADVFSVPSDALDEKGELKVNGPRLTFFFTKNGEIVLEHRLYLKKGANYMDTRKAKELFHEVAVDLYKEGEAGPIELKSSFMHSADKQEDPDKSPRQFLKILSAIAGAANTRFDVDFKLVVGVKDNRVISGIENEVADEDEANFEATFRNYIWQKTGSRIFSASVIFSWEHIKDHKICTLILKPWKGDLVFVDGCQLYVRQGAQTVQYQNGDLVSFIKSYQN